jgi:hypothetical protein
MAEKNSLWKNIRNKAKQNRASGTPPKEPTDEMLRQEAKINSEYAEGGYMYPDGGTYANNQGVIMGPIKNPDGSFTLPATQDGTPVVNLPEFEVVSTPTAFGKPNPYSPVSLSEFANSGFNPINMFLPDTEREQQPIDPRTGMRFPASGRAAPDYTIESAFMGSKPNYTNFEKGVNRVGKDVEKYSKRALRYNTKYNPVSNKIKDIGTKIARINSDPYRDTDQILKGVKGENSGNYYGQIANDGDIIYGPDARDLNSTYFKGSEAGLKKTNYDISKDPGLKESINWYGDLNSYLLNSRIPHGENIDILDFLKSINYYQWNEADGFNTGKYFLTEGVENLMKDYPGENLLDLGKLTGGKKIGLQTFTEDQLKTVKDNIDYLFSKHGSNKIPFEIGRPNTSGAVGSRQGFQFFDTNPIHPIDDIAGHMGFLEKDPVTGDVNFTTRDIWGFRPQSYLKKYNYNNYGQKIKPFSKEALQVHLMDSFGKPFVLHQTNPIKFKDGGYTNPYMYYSGGPMQYEVGGKVWKNIAAGLYGAGEGILDTVTMGATDQLTDKGFEALSKVGNKNIDLNNPDDVKFLKTQQKVKGYTNTAGAIGAGIATGNVQGAIKQGTKGLNTAFQATDGLSDDFKQWSQGITGVVGVASGLAGGLNSDSFNAASKAGTGVAGFGKDVSKFAGVGNTAMGFIPGMNDAPLWQQGDARQDYLNSPEHLAMKERENQQYVNQGLSFEQGGNINNNSLNLQNSYSMKDRYIKYRQQQMAQGGIYKISEEAGTHDENAYGGVPIGKNAKVEGGEYIIPLADGNQYVISANKNGELSDGGIAKEYERKIKRGSPLRPQEQKDSQNKESIAQATNAAIQENERQLAESKMKEQQDEIMKTAALQYAAAGGKISKDIAKIVEEEYAAAYGGYINPKKYKGLNMPYSGGGKLPKEVLRARVESHMSPQEADAYVNQYAEGGGIHIKKSKKGTFTAAATKHGKSVQEFARQVLANKDNYSPAMVKKANFARNAAGWKHAQGGPMVSNVSQPFNGPSAQNRGGMMMANGGRMYAEGGPDYDPEKLKAEGYVEYPNYWLHPTKGYIDKPAEEIYSRGESAAAFYKKNLEEYLGDPSYKVSPSSIKPMEGRIGYPSLPLKSSYINAEGYPRFYGDNVGFNLQVEDVAGPEFGTESWENNQNRRYPILNEQGEIQTTPEDYNRLATKGMEGQSFSNNYNQIQSTRDKVKRAYESQFGKLNQPKSEPIQSISQFNTAGFIPPDVMANRMGTSTAPFTDGVGPVNTSIPRDIPNVSTNIENLPELTEKSIDFSSPLGTFEGVNTDNNSVSINPALKSTYDQGWRPEGLSNLKPNQPNQPNQGLTGLDYASMGMQALAPLSQLYYGAKGPDPVNYERITANKIDPTVAIILAAEESRRAQDTAGYNLRQNAPTSGSYMSNMRGLGLGAGKNRGLQSASLRQAADVENTRMQNQVNAQNAQISMQEQIDRLQEKDAARTNITEGLSGLGSSTANMIRDYRTNQVNQTIAKNIGTNDWKFDPINETITFRNKDGNVVTVPAQTVIPSNFAANVGTGKIQNPGTSQFQTSIDESLNTGFTNRFRGPNSGK